MREEDHADLNPQCTFASFRDASDYAKELAMVHRAETAVKASEDGWQVLVPDWLGLFLIAEQRDTELGISSGATRDEPDAWEKDLEDWRPADLYDDTDGPDPARPKFPTVNFTGSEDDDDES